MYKYLYFINTSLTLLNAELNPIRHLLALVGAHHFVHINRVRVKYLLLTAVFKHIRQYARRRLLHLIS